MPFYILRHAHKEPGKYFNPVLRHQDSPLSERGKAEAEHLVSYFTKKKITAIYVSGYLRTMQTIEPLSRKLGLTITKDARLNELDNGLLDDMSEQEFEKAFPKEWKAYISRTEDFRFPDGETGKEAGARIGSFLEEKRKKHTGENILIVGHDGIIRVAMCYLLGLPVFHRGDFAVDLCGLTEVEFQEDIKRWKILRFNQGMQKNNAQPAAAVGIRARVR